MLATLNASGIVLQRSCCKTSPGYEVMAAYCRIGLYGRLDPEQPDATGR
jgi:hypothetical protein